MNQIYTRKNLFIGLVVLLALFAFFVLYSYRSMRKAVHETNIVNTSLQSLRALEEIMDDIQEIETVLRNYLISGQAESLTPYRAANQQLDNDIPRIKALYPLYPARQQSFDQLLQLISRKRAAEEETIRLVGEKGMALANAGPIGHTATIDSIRTIITSFEKEDRVILNNSNAERQVAARATAKLFIGLALLFILGLLFLFWRMNKGLKVRKQYEERIAYLAGLTEKTHDAIFSTDLTYTVRTWNNGAYKMYGYTSEEATGRSVSSLLNITGIDFDIEKTRQELRDRGYYEGEFRAVKKSGETIFIQASISVLKNEQNILEGYVAVHRDISERVKAEQLLQMYNEGLTREVKEKTTLAENILERISDGFYSTDQQWKFTYMNKTAGIIMGCDPLDIVGKNLWEEFPEAANLSIYQAYHNAFADQVYRQVEFYYPPFDKWFMVDIYPSPSGLSTFFRDITERKMVEEELRHSYERLEMISRTTNDAVWEWDLESGKMWANETHQQLYGLSLADPVPPEHIWIERIHPEDRERLKRKQAEALAGKTNIFITEYRFNTEQSGYRNIYDRCYIVRNSQGIATRILGSMMDITGLKKTEERLKRREAQLVASIENTPNVAVQWYNSKGEVMYWNHASEILYGWTSAEALGKTMDQLGQSPASANEFLELLRKVTETGETIGPNEYAFIKRNGVTGFCMSTVFSIPSVEGEPYFVSMDVDITESKRFAEALQQSEEKYRTIIDQASDGIFIMNDAAKFIEVNHAGLQMSGYTREEILSMHETDLLPGGEESVVLNKLHELRSGESFVMERKIKLKDASVRDIDVSYKMLSNGLILAIERDITERKKAEQELITSEETRRLIMNSALDAIVGMDTRGHITIWTPQAEKIFGWKESEVIGRSLGETIVPPQYRNAHVQGLVKYMQTGKGPVLNKLIEITALHRDGTEFPVELSILPVTQGENEFFCAFIRDITERKRSEEEIKRAHERYEMIGKATNDAIWDVNMLTMEKWGNESLYQLYGLDRDTDNLSAVELFSRVHPDDNEKLQASLNDAFKRHAPYIVLEFRFRTPDLSYKSFLDRAFIQYDLQGNPMRLIGAMQDITERKKTEQAVRESEEKYRTLVEQAVDAIALYDAQGRILDVNTGSVNLLGYSKEELMRMSLADILTKEEIADRPVQYDVLRKGSSTVKERKMRRKDGTVIDTEVRSQQLPDGRFLSVIRDLTERIRAEESLAASYEAIRQLTGHIQDVREEERTNIAREIHDELGQQLTVLKMDVSWLKKKMVNADEPIREKLKELITMLDETVRTVRRISSELRPSILDDLGLVAAMEWQLGEFEKRADIVTHFIHPEEELILPDAIKTALFRVLQESLTNVARHSGATEVNVSISWTNNKLELSIRDNGRGFEKQTIADKQTLGILGMQERIAMIGGVYQINTQPGEGTEVKVDLVLVKIKPII